MSRIESNLDQDIRQNGVLNMFCWKLLERTADPVMAIFSTPSGRRFHVFILLSSANQYFDLSQFKEKHKTAVSVAEMAKSHTFLLPSSASLEPTLLAQARIFLAAQCQVITGRTKTTVGAETNREGRVLYSLINCSR